MQESPLYTKTYDLLLWLIPQVQKFPRAHRFGLAERIQRLAMEFQDALVLAGKSKGSERRQALGRADVQLEQLRIWVRLARDFQLLTLRQYEHAARLLSEVGRLLGAWLKQVSA
ncbi:MAG TPA: diversity-generating retroelement protein Avd [Anaerolineales bacterium]|nr:diversity-generating retroelement protein Avd [Anaerolineales bacterium]